MTALLAPKSRFARLAPKFDAPVMMNEGGFAWAGAGNDMLAMLDQYGIPPAAPPPPAYSPGTFTPPSFSGGGGLAQGIPQTSVGTNWYDQQADPEAARYQFLTQSATGPLGAEALAFIQDYERRRQAAQAQSQMEQMEVQSQQQYQPIQPNIPPGLVFGPQMGLNAITGNPVIDRPTGERTAPQNLREMAMATGAQDYAGLIPQPVRDAYGAVGTGLDALWEASRRTQEARAGQQGWAPGVGAFQQDYQGVQNLAETIGPKEPWELLLEATPLGWAGDIRRGLQAPGVLPAIDNVARPSVLDVPQNAPEALRTADTAGLTVVPRSATPAQAQTLPGGISLRGAAEEIPDDVSRLAFGDVDRTGLRGIDAVPPAEDLSSVPTDNVRGLYQTATRDASLVQDQLDTFLKTHQYEDGATGATRTLTDPAAIEARANAWRQQLYYHDTEARKWRAELARRESAAAAPVDDSVVARLADSVDEADLISRIRQLDDMDKMKLTLEMGQNDRAAMLEVASQVNAATAGDMAAATAIKARLFEDAAHMSKRVAQMTGQAPGDVRRGAIGRAAEGLRKLAADETGSVTPGLVGQGVTRGVGGFLENLTALPSVAKQLQASGDVLGSSVRQNLPVAFIDPKIWGVNAQRSLRAYFGGDDMAKGVFAEIQNLPRFADDDVFEVGDKAIVVPSMRKVLGIGEDFATPGFEKLNNSVVQRMADHFPLLGRSERSMRAALIGAATDLRNQMIESAIKAGVDDESYYEHYGKLARIAVGYGDVPEALKGFQKQFYSLRNLSARFQTIAGPITRPGQVFRSPVAMARDKAIFSADPRGVATKNLTRFMAGETANLAFLSAAGASTGLFEVGWNPLESGYGSLVYTDDDGNDYAIDLMGGYGSYIKAITRTAATAYDSYQGKPWRFDPAKEWFTFGRYKLAPGPAIALDTVIATSPNFRDVPALQSPFATDVTKIDLKDPKTWLDQGVLEKFLPFFAGGPIQALATGDLPTTPDGLMKAGATMLAGWAGAPIDLRPADVFDKSDIGIQKALGEGQTYTNAAGETVPLPTTYIDAEGKSQPVKTLGDLRAADPLAADWFNRQNPELAAERTEESSPTTQRIRELQAAHFEDQVDRDSEILPLDPEAWRKASSEASQMTAAAIRERAEDYDGTPEQKTLLSKTLDEYFKAIDENKSINGVNWEAVDRTVAGFTPEQKSLLASQKLVGETEPRKEYLRDIEKLEPYFEVRDRAFDEWKEGDSEMEQFNSYDEYRVWVRSQFKREGSLSNADADAKADRYLATLDKWISAQSQGFFTESDENFDLLPVLDQWGFYVPSKFRPYIGSLSATPSPVPAGVR